MNIVKTGDNYTTMNLTKSFIIIIMLLGALGRARRHQIPQQLLQFLQRKF